MCLHFVLIGVKETPDFSWVLMGGKKEWFLGDEDVAPRFACRGSRSLRVFLVLPHPGGRDTGAGAFAAQALGPVLVKEAHGDPLALLPAAPGTVPLPALSPPTPTPQL